MRATMEQLIHFHTHGYVIIEDVLTDADFQPVIAEISGEIDRRARNLHKEGKLGQLYEQEPFERRYAKLFWQCAEIGRGLDIMQLRGAAMFRFLLNNRLLDMVECFLGRELSCNPIQHLRHKLPVQPGARTNGFNGNVPWHQDVAVTHPDSDPSDIVTFWIPLVDATRETGCMEIIPDVFRRGLLPHASSPEGTAIDPRVLPDRQPITAECRKGGIVIMNKYTPHRGTDNISDRIRWSLDLRYHKTGAHSGRESLPSFAVRPHEAVSADHAQWDLLWKEALAQPKSASFHRV